MNCPMCDGRSTVSESRDLGDHVIRRRKCLECGYPFFTEEIDSKTAEAEYLQFHADNRLARRRKKGAIK